MYIFYNLLITVVLFRCSDRSCDHYCFVHGAQTRKERKNGRVARKTEKERKRKRFDRVSLESSRLDNSNQDSLLVEALGRIVKAGEGFAGPHTCVLTLLFQSAHRVRGVPHAGSVTKTSRAVLESCAGVDDTLPRRTAIRERALKVIDTRRTLRDLIHTAREGA